ncbi:2-octaprenyl-6-methoxyphenyl hydroxylase [Luteimonas sp. JM171]|uniref:2-octaprenyl-6-methoxyphenyl hydroxylase n=1 Tax=Luteimonas sp. JM171 TaxID=1896164 RepID=UPI0008585A14|nr:2-octaprenyl-6-methoxyphenyl hydroxylase [Luteimonas sp. JM171]AOH35145.1 2-octaprenyl-6-methoxyphenyl hydroxylase [Luteimonas sp. JM171]
MPPDLSDRTTRCHDVLIVGGGLVGASLAIALDGLGLDVAQVEAAPAGALPPVFDQRNLSFADATVNALTALGVLQELRTPPGPIRRIHVSRAGDFGRVLMEASAYGRDAFGQVVVASDFGHALEQRLGRVDGLVRYRPARFLAAAPAGESLAVRIAGADGERTLHARLLVGADGAASGVREALDIHADTHDYGQSLLVARVRASRPPDGTAWERFTAHGPTALLPRGDRHYGVVHGVARAQAAAALEWDDSEFLARVQSAFGWRAGRFLGAGPRSAYPMVRTVARRITAPRAVLVGNAAQSMHPVGAQGFNLGLRDALTLAELVAEHRQDPGCAALLEAYARRRQEDRARTLEFSDGLARVTANDAPLLRPLRSLGLMAVDRLPALQARVAGGAMGFRGDVPALCRVPA